MDNNNTNDTSIVDFYHYQPNMDWNRERAEYKPLYENITFDFLMDRMLSKIPNNFDKRQGSVIWDALAPAAIELVNLYQELDYILKNSFGDTADREFLIHIARDRDVHIEPATHAEVLAEFDRRLNIGHRFNQDKLNYRVTEFIEEKNGLFYYRLTCEELGTQGNIEHGNLTPIDNILNLSVARIIKVIKPGEDEEDTEVFRKRYFREISRKDYGGNIEDYQRKVLAIEGVGGVKVYPVWNGGGTVKLVIQTTEWRTPPKELVADVQEKIDPIPHHQKGVGIAPIGHYVTVEGVKEKEINIELTLYGDDYELRQKEVETLVDNYLLNLRIQWQNKQNLVVRKAHIESVILGIAEIQDVTDTKINGQSQNLELADDEIPILGVVKIAQAK